jgi:SAM-dependent methyltransferase
MDEYTYQGNELDLFQHAVTWKRYYASRLAPYISGDVVEVGAGIGGTGRYLCNDRVTTWTCIEPDPRLADRLETSLENRPLPVAASVMRGTLGTLEAARRFDTVLYIDVLEHIEDDRGELVQAARHLAPGGKVVVLAPAHQWLFSPFDSAVGHYRRYDRASLLGAASAPLRVVSSFYLDSAGLLASLANKMLLKAEIPTLGQIHLWDTRIVPVSKIVDRVTGHHFGKTVVAVWTSA